jgi:hypothetical protein
VGVLTWLHWGRYWASNCPQVARSIWRFSAFLKIWAYRQCVPHRNFPDPIIISVKWIVICVIISIDFDLQVITNDQRDFRYLTKTMWDTEMKHVPLQGELKNIFYSMWVK